MFEIDRQKFGAFVAALRREKGLTQKELAARLYISDKAVSKWETGVSIPDVALLVPLSEELDISVMELLKCQRIEKEEPMNAGQVEDLIRKAIVYWEENPRQGRSAGRKQIGIFVLCALAACLEIGVMYVWHIPVSEPVRVILLLSAVFGFYMMVLVKEKLPRYYDENKVSTYNDGPVRMNLGFGTISNRNWPYLVKVFRCWTMGMLAGYPALHILMRCFFPAVWGQCEKWALLCLILGGLLVPALYVGKKHQ